ncbi:hypothetical protein OK016_30110 [Vibrio chagasii]|nr:hypothetical protein [Vibrio chagasii]
MKQKDAASAAGDSIESKLIIEAGMAVAVFAALFGDVVIEPFHCSTNSER